MKKFRSEKKMRGWKRSIGYNSDITSVVNLAVYTRINERVDR